MVKVKINTLTDASLARIKELNIIKAQICIAARPFITPTYVALKTGLPIQFILDNRKEIGI